MLSIIKTALWDEDAPKEPVRSETFETLLQHRVSSLAAPVLQKLIIPVEIRDSWKNSILQQISYYQKYIYRQENLPIDVPYVILKGTSAAKYYPHPEFRAMGDIDIITRHEDFDRACQQFNDAGYRIVKKLDREIGFEKDGVMIELHRYFSLLTDPKEAQYLDELIIENINPSHVLPDLVNGLVLLEHVDQHLEGGIGLRQIIDWMMFVDKCLSDKQWPIFRLMVHDIGLEKLAGVLTRMCEKYIGLPERQWCKAGDETLCDQLMKYVIACGNFGNLKQSDDDVSENVFTVARTPRAVLRLLQSRGLANWAAASKHRWLRPFAWIYQACRYLLRGLRREKAGRKILAEYKAAKQRNQMLDALGVKRLSDGHTAYIDGEYIKK